MDDAPRPVVPVNVSERAAGSDVEDATYHQ